LSPRLAYARRGLIGLSLNQLNILSSIFWRPYNQVKAVRERTVAAFSSRDRQKVYGEALLWWSQPTILLMGLNSVIVRPKGQCLRRLPIADDRTGSGALVVYDTHLMVLIVLPPFTSSPCSLYIEQHQSVCGDQDFVEIATIAIQLLVRAYVRLKSLICTELLDPFTTNL
jgi:hypothetical protein